MERYASRSKAQKLGIKEGSTVALFDAPRDYAAVLGEMPAGVELVEEPDSVHPVTLWFVRDPRDYRMACGARVRSRSGQDSGSSGARDRPAA